jgi:hypothetical protein
MMSELGAGQGDSCVPKSAAMFNEKRMNEEIEGFRRIRYVQIERWKIAI